jgi:hypothetical protein
MLGSTPSSEDLKLPRPLDADDIEEFRRIVKEECGVELDRAAAWNRANEIMALYLALLRPIPEDKAVRSETPKANAVLSLPIPSPKSKRESTQQRLPF